MIDLTPHLAGFIAAYSILLVAASSPGPAVAMLLGIGLSRGRGPALMATWGIASGSVLLNIGTLVGVGLLISQAAWAMSVLRVLGAAYLLWLAWGAFRKAAKGAEVQVTDVPALPAWRYFAMGFLLQVTNPKAIVFWLAIAAVGATAGGGLDIIIAFIIGAFVVSFACHGAWAVLLSSSPIRAAYGRARRGIEALLGTFLAFAAFRLATER